jgi:hypothetical protein
MRGWGDDQQHWLWPWLPSAMAAGRKRRSWPPSGGLQRSFAYLGGGWREREREGERERERKRERAGERAGERESGRKREKEATSFFLITGCPL